MEESPVEEMKKSKFTKERKTFCRKQKKKTKKENNLKIQRKTFFFLYSSSFVFF